MRDSKGHSLLNTILLKSLSIVNSRENKKRTPVFPESAEKNVRLHYRFKVVHISYAVFTGMYRNQRA